MTDTKMPKNAEIFFCEYCDFKCCKKSNYDKHLLTSKHKNTDKILTNTDASVADNATSSNAHICDCGKEYKHNSGLWRHKQGCKPNDPLLEKVQRDSAKLKPLRSKTLHNVVNIVFFL